MDAMNLMMEKNACNLMVPSFARGLSILLVDHDTTSLMYLALMLEQYSYKVSTTELATVALSMIQENHDRFKLVIANVNMSDMACYHFLRVLIKMEIPIILMASERNLSATTKALAEGASFFLEKPVSLDDLKYIWQHVYKLRKNNLAVQLQKRNREMYENDNMTRGMSIGEANDLQYSTNYLPIIVDLREKNKQAKEVEFLAGENSTGTKRSLYNNEGEKGKQKKVVGQDPGHISNDNMIFNKETEKELMSGKLEEPEKERDENHTSFVNGRLVWTPELHFKFTAALKALGNIKPRPKQILKLMRVPNLTQRQVASHLQKHKLALAKYNAQKAAAAGLPLGNRPLRKLGSGRISGQPHEKTIKSSVNRRGCRSSSIAIGFGGQSSSGTMPNSGKSSNLELNAVPILTPPAAGSIFQAQPSTELENLAKLLEEEEEFPGSASGVNPSDIDRYYRSLSEALLGNNQLPQNFRGAS